ncbi:alpha/beta-hydrolase [Eremomyces bilateralis CBS 781.70]|uniref:Cutinase n=1 Tax=Eremomyces bilateralis CBS 781.70 TaxID=1392243 RepID=A0A6G1G4G6_9PEZI|nr:alpha/beta-hydrolase [Eremomyces bilateralis CBS 781.70]KAF1812841.1 alpha/beta-hydrolase [Eremomyces bilateralis CBS 781.70]
MLGSLGGSSASDIKENGECKSVALIFARGTGEPGNMGFVVGPGLGSQLKTALNNDVMLQGADYTTDFSGGGAKDIIATTQQLKSRCPDTKVVLGGYSQGAMQVHDALGQVGGDVAAAVTFGDPYSSVGFGGGSSLLSGFMGGAGSGAGSGGGSGGSFNAENGKVFCSTGDFICGLMPGGSGGSTSSGSGSGGHLSYSSDGSIPEAVKFIVSKVGGGAA